VMMSPVVTSFRVGGGVDSTPLLLLRGDWTGDGCFPRSELFLFFKLIVLLLGLAFGDGVRSVNTVETKMQDRGLVRSLR
jgi:hypothetical protein